MRLRGARRLPQVAKVDEWKREGARRLDDLDGEVVLHAEARAQHLVTTDDLRERPPQRRYVERPAQPRRHGDVIGRAVRIEVMHEPEALLRERQRHRPTMLARPQRRRRERVLAGRGGQQRGKSRDGRRLEERAQRHLGREQSPHPRQQLHRQQRVPAQLEEVVFNSHALDTQQVLPHPAQHFFGRRLRPQARGLTRRLRLLGRGQGGPIHLAVARQRQLVEQHERRRHHVLGQMPSDVTAQVTDRRRLFRVEYDVGDQSHVTGRALADCGGAVAHSRVLAQHRLHLPEFHPRPAHLHLPVAPPDELQPPARAPPDDVSRPVEPRP